MVYLMLCRIHLLIELILGQAYVEMTNAADAEAMVNHHTSEPLKIKGSVIQVDFSSEYETLK